MGICCKDAAEKVENDEAQMTETVFDVVAEYP